MTALLLAIALALAVGGAIAALMLRDPGYVLIAYDGMTAETSLWIALGALLALWFAIAATAFLVRRFRSGSRRVAGWLRRRRNRSAQALGLQGAMLLAEQRWDEARTALLDAAPLLEAPFGAYLGAARAANEAGASAERDRILDTAKKYAPDAAFILDLSRSEWQQAAGEWRPSIDTLLELRRQAPRHPLVRKRLFAAYAALGDWHAATELADTFEAAEAAATATARIAAWRQRLRAAEGSAAEVQRIWKAVPKNLRDDENLLLEYIDRLVAADAAGEAESVLRRHLKRRWNPALVRRYGTLPADAGNAEKYLRTARGWLAEHAAEAAVQMAVARLALRAGDAHTARRHFEASAAAAPCAEAFAELAHLAERNGDAAAANDYYRRALQHGGSRSAPRTEPEPPAADFRHAAGQQAAPLPE